MSRFDVQYSTMSPALPFDILALIIDIVGENKDTDLLKELALVSHSFLQICSKHLFATVELRNPIRPPSRRDFVSPKKRFLKLLKRRPDVVRNIRKLAYEVSRSAHIGARVFPSQDSDHLLSFVLLHLLPSFSRLNCLAISASGLDWNALDPSLTTAFLRLMHLPTINHIDLSYIQNFPLISLTLPVNLHRLDIFCLTLHRPLKMDFPEIVVEMMPKIREFHTSGSFQFTTKLLHAKRQDGHPAFNFMDLRRLSTTLNQFDSEFDSEFDDERDIQYLLENSKFLESFHLYLGHGRSIARILSPGARILKVLDLAISFFHMNSFDLGEFYEELEALAGHNLLETLFFKVVLFDLVTEDFVGSIFQEVEKVLVKPGWSMLRQVFFKVSIAPIVGSVKLCEVLRSLPDKYLSHLSKLESIAFDYSVYVDSIWLIFPLSHMFCNLPGWMLSNCQEYTYNALSLYLYVGFIQPGNNTWDSKHLCLCLYINL